MPVIQPPIMRVLGWLEFEVAHFIAVDPCLTPSFFVSRTSTFRHLYLNTRGIPFSRSHLCWNVPSPPLSARSCPRDIFSMPLVQTKSPGFVFSFFVFQLRLSSEFHGLRGNSPLSAFFFYPAELFSRRRPSANCIFRRFHPGSYHEPETYVFDE